MISDAYVRVTCDECGDETEVELTALAGRGQYDMRYVINTLIRDGWQAEKGSDRTICEGCLEEEDE